MGGHFVFGLPLPFREHHGRVQGGRVAACSFLAWSPRWASCFQPLLQRLPFKLFDKCLLSDTVPRAVPACCLLLPCPCHCP